jgi:hypothetical protein
MKKKSSSVSRGNYYKKLSKKYYEEKGFTVELTEFMAARFIAPGKVIYQKKDILKSDGCAYNETEFILWNSKSAIKPEYVSREKSQGSKEYRELIVPKFIKKQLIIWQPRQKPIIVDVD